MSRRISAALFIACLAGCTPPPQTAATRASAAALASCRQSADSSFQRQNRYLLSERDQTDTPFSTSGLSGITTRGLGQRYDYDNQLSSCLAASDADNSQTAPATSSAPAGRLTTTPLPP